MVDHYIKILLTVLLTTLLSVPIYGQTEDRLVQLDASLNLRSAFEKQKELRITHVRKQLANTKDDRSRYQLLHNMFDEYKSYCYDSAVAYALKSRVMAERIGEPELIVKSKFSTAFCLISAGLLSEARSLMDSIPVSELAQDLRSEYFERNSQLWRSMADYAHDNPFYDKYIAKANAYQDSLIAITPKNTAMWYKYSGSLQMRNHEYEKALKSFKAMLEFPDVPDHERAMATAEMAWAYIFLDNEDNAIDCFAQSAIYDNETSTREITALYHLSRLIYKRGDYERASRYVHQALNDVQFYNSRLRKVEIGDILPIIEEDRYKAVRSQRNWFMAASILFIGLLVAILYAYVAIRKKNRKLDEAREMIAGQLKLLKEVNERLTQVNSQLTEADKIKTAYIGRSFYTNAEFISKLEKAYRAIDRKITTRQYEDLRHTLKESALNAERENMYAAFDQTFLKLFPSFVERYNALFAPDDRKMPPDNESLTNEMRIFALIRLGITDSERIANFLNYSVHTVNTYKTRIKNRSTAENDQFEHLIMEI